MRKYRRSTSNRPAGRHDRTLPACPERPPLVHPTQHHLTAAGATEPATYWHHATHHISCRYIRAWGRQALVFTHLLLSAGSRVAQQTGTRENRRDASRATGRHASTRTERTRTRVDARELFIGELFIHCRGWSFVAFFFGCATSTTMLFSLSVTSCLLTSSTPPCVVAVLITAITQAAFGVQLDPRLDHFYICLLITCSAAVSLFLVGAMLSTVRATFPAAVSLSWGMGLVVTVLYWLLFPLLSLFMHDLLLLVWVRWTIYASRGNCD